MQSRTNVHLAYTYTKCKLHQITARFVVLTFTLTLHWYLNLHLHLHLYKLASFCIEASRFVASVLEVYWNVEIKKLVEPYSSTNTHDNVCELIPHYLIELHS